MDLDPGVLAMMIPIVALLVGGAVTIAKINRPRSASAEIPRDIGARLDRMEQSIEAIALEIERISEGQRFTTKLLSDRGSGSSPAIASPPTEHRP